MNLSIVIPVFNEEKNVEILYRRIKETVKGSYETIFVDDGSKDRTFEELKKLKGIKIVRLRRNSGQTAAIDAGIKHSKGKIIATIDGDLQNDPADIPRLLEKLDQGYDVVSGWRYNRKDRFEKRIFSKIADILRRLFISDKIHDSGCSLKVYRKECFENLDLHGEMHRFIPALLRIRGFEVGELKVRHLPRRFGKTKYTTTRVLKGFLDLINIWFWMKFEGRPLHLFGGLGLMFTGLGSLGGLFSIYRKIIYNMDLSRNFIAVASMLLFVIGINFLISGLMADIMLKTYYKTSGMSYQIKEIVEK